MSDYDFPIFRKNSAVIIVVISWNFLFFRYVCLDLNDRLMDGLILQWPWWNLEKAITRGYFVKWEG